MHCIIITIIVMKTSLPLFYLVVDKPVLLRKKEGNTPLLPLSLAHKLLFFFFPRAEAESQSHKSRHSYRQTSELEEELEYLRRRTGYYDRHSRYDDMDRHYSSRDKYYRSEALPLPSTRYYGDYLDRGDHYRGGGGGAGGGGSYDSYRGDDPYYNPNPYGRASYSNPYGKSYPRRM